MLNDSMVRNSPYILQQDKYDKIFRIFYEVIGNNKSREEFNRIMLELLTQSERIMLMKRIAVIYLLMKNINYRIICKVLKVSNTTVSKFRLMIERSEGIVPALKLILTIDKVAIFFEEVFNELYHPGLYGINWQSAWQRKINLEHKKSEGL